jgi:phosphate transport system substrate-binding protein
MKQQLKKWALVAMTLVMTTGLAACGSSTTSTGGEGALSGTIRIDGSSTVFPISQAVAEEFMAKYPDVRVTVGESGTSGGFKKLIGGEIEIADASRTIKKPKDGEKSEPGKETEYELLTAKGEEVIEMAVALDGITIVINPKNTFATEMTVEELNKVWMKDSKVTKWSDIRPEWPAQEIRLYGPGTASGTFEFFTKAINGKEKESRADYTQSEDDNVLVKGVAGDEFSMGYFGYAYYEENNDKLTAVKIKADANSPAIGPSIDSIKDGSYKPLSRDVYIYTTKSAASRPEMKEFLKYFNSPEGQGLIEFVKYIPKAQEDYEANIKLIP